MTQTQTPAQTQAHAQTQTATPPHAAPGHHTVTPYAIVPDARQAMAFYARAFGAVQTSLSVDDTGKVRHAEIRIGDSPVMLAEHFDFSGVVARSPAGLGATSLHFYLYVPDVDALHAQAISAGAREVMPVTDQHYGERSGGVVDPFGHVWWLATYGGDRR
jgi:PhnB protein